MSSAGSGPPELLPSVVSVEWLANALKLVPSSSVSPPPSTPVHVFDCSWYLPATNRDALAEYDASHIPGAVFFDVDYQADRTSPFPHMLPRAADFSLLMRALHISNADTIILYDASSAYCAAARVWFTFLAMSHPPHLLRLLDGGFQCWLQSFRHLTQASPSPSTPASLPPPLHPAPASPYTATVIPSLLWTGERILSALDSASPPLIIDARDPARFDGREPEPRPSRRRGHIPHSVNVWHVELQTVLTEGRQGFKPRDELLRLLKERGISHTQQQQEDRDIVCVCGSGITACTDFFVLHELGFRRLGLYDESMCQWLNTDKLPIEP